MLFTAIVLTLYLYNMNKKSLKTFNSKEELPYKSANFINPNVKTTNIEKSDFDKEMAYLNWLNKSEKENGKRQNIETEE